MAVEITIKTKKTMLNSYTCNIQRQEDIDRYVTTECLKQLLRKHQDLKITPTDLYCAVDLKGQVKNVKFNVEIKERNKTEEQLQKYPVAELKEEKLKRIQDETPQDTSLLYVVLLNQKTFMMFNLSKTDFSKVEKRNWRIKRTQMNPNSDYVTVPTYFIPYSSAIVTMDCSKYFKEYANNQETTEN